MLLLTVQPEKIPPLFLSAQTDDLNLLELWSLYVSGQSAQTNANAGEWVEESLRLKTTVEQFGEENIALRIFGNKKFHAKNLGTGEIYSKSETSSFDVYGFSPDRNEQELRYEQSRLANAYALYSSFTANAGRRITLGGFNSEQNDLVNTLHEFSSQGERDFYIKMVESKAGLFRISLPEAPSKSEIADSVFSQMSWHLSKVECRENMLTIQECIPMLNEYRFFIIDGTLVTGAGCIEEFSYLNHKGKQFDTQLRKHRDLGSPVYDTSLAEEIVSRYIAFAHDSIQEFKNEIPALKNYVLDVAQGKSGEPVVIELNDLLSSGMYASDTFAITKAYAQYLGYKKR